MRVNLEARANTAAVRRDRTRARLLDAAMAIIARGGVEAASVDAVVAAAGVARGTFYNYFPTTSALVHALLGRLTEDALGELAERGPLGDPAAWLAAAWSVYLARAAGDPLWAWTVMRLEPALASQPAISDRFQASFRAGVASGRFRPGSPMAAESLVFGAMRTVMRDVLTRDAPPGHGWSVLELVLVGLGLTPEDAARIIGEAASPPR